MRGCGMSNTRPASSDPADIAAWEEERARLREERDFRDKAMEFFGESRAETKAMREDITAMRGDMHAHEQRDKERFAAMQEQHDQLAKKVGSHTQIIIKNKSNWNLVWTVGAAAVAIFGIVWTIVKGG